MPESDVAAHKRIIRRLYDDFFTAGQVDIAEELMTDDYLNHDPPPVVGPTRDDLEGAVGEFHRSLPDFQAELIRLVAEGDFVATQGEFSGHSAAGDLTRIKILDMFRFKHGRIAERWG